MILKKLTLAITVTAALLTGGIMLAVPERVSAEYNGANIIDNSVFLDASTMGPNEIQSFLASKGSGLASMSFVLQCYGSGSQERQLYTSVGAACDQPMSAAHIIYYASRIYGVNPQVTLATMQKEQSLITTANPTSWQINQAMGYGCPTTGNCSGNSTFSYQIDSGVWALRYHYERANGNNNWWSPSSGWVCGTEKNFYKPNLYPGQNVHFYDGNGVHYRTYFIENAATSAFYCYTPHAYNNPQGLFGRPPFGTTGQYYSGSYNFVTAFEAWFGSTQGGELVRTPSNGQVYLINNDIAKKYPINSTDVFNDYSPLKLRFVSDAYLSQFTTGQAVTNMAQSPDGTLSLIIAGIKLPFTSCSGDVVDYGFTCASDQFIPLTSAQSIRLVSGPGVTDLARSNTDPTIYYVKNGQKRPIGSWSDATSYNIPTAFNVLTSGFMNRLPTGPGLYAPGSLVKTPSSSTIYAVKDMTNLMPITSFSYPQDLGLSTAFRVMSDSDFQNVYNSASGASNLTNRVTCNSTNYIGTNGSLFAVSGGMATNYGYSNGDFVDPGGICSKLQVSSQSLSQYIRTSDGTIYYVSGGQKRAFTSYQTFQSASYCNNSACTVNHVSNSFASSIPSGANL